MSISEQVKELRKWANCVHLTGHNYEILNQAADTIEALSAKLENAYYVKRNGKDDIIVSIMYNKADNKYHFVNLSKNHICACGFETTEEAIADMEQRKNNGSICDFYLIERSVEDCGGGIISLEECIDILKESKRQSEVVLQNPTVFYSEKSMRGGCETMKKHIEAYSVAINCLEKML